MIKMNLKSQSIKLQFSATLDVLKDENTNQYKNISTKYPYIVYWFLCTFDLEYS